MKIKIICFVAAGGWAAGTPKVSLFSSVGPEKLWPGPSRRRQRGRDMFIHELSSPAAPPWLQ
eukprot:scaffold123042_cov28-Tisochrysis_lutea.AAC.1